MLATRERREIVDAVNERDKLADSRLGLGKGLEVASSALHYVQTYASSAIRAAEKKGFAPAIGGDKP